MAGLGAPARTPSPGTNAPEQAMQGEGEAASPEEQALYDAFVKKGLGVIYPEKSDGQVSGEILANLKGDFDPQILQMFEASEPALTDSPQDSAAATSVLVTIMVEGSLGQPVGEEITMHAGKVLVEELIEVSEAAGIHDFNEKDVETVWYRALDLYRIASPNADQEALSREFEQIVQADKDGRLGDILPGLPGGAPMQKGAA